MLDTFVTQFTKTFIESRRYETFFNGFVTTISITLFAAIIGITIGVLVAIIKTYNYQTGKFKLGNTVCDIYLTIFRGTPVVVQLMIWYYIILTGVSNGVYVAIIGFGINSGAYVSEAFRAGILAVDHGQTEAGRSLGLSSFATMRHIVLPQAFKNSLPSIFNELISLLKETSVVGYITVIDITKAGELIRSRTMMAFFPLLSVAFIYLVLVIMLTAVQKKVERRLRAGDKR